MLSYGLSMPPAGDDCDGVPEAFTLMGGGTPDEELDAEG